MSEEEEVKRAAKESTTLTTNKDYRGEGGAPKATTTMLQPRRGEAVQSRRPRDNGLIYTTLIVFLSVATFNYAVGLAVAG